MNTRYRRSEEALVCGHCGAMNRMEVIGSIMDTDEDFPKNLAPYEAGTLYQLHACPECKKVVLVSGIWHDGMADDPELWSPKVLLPEPDDQIARQHLAEHKLDSCCMRRAVDEARKCVTEASASSPKPKVGAVVVLSDTKVIAAHRGELGAGNHAEFTLLDKKCRDEKLAGSTVYTTLEPCTTRNAPKTPCVEWLINRKVARVVIGMLDPDERIRGRGVLTLRKANIRVDLFPPELMSELEEMNHEFIHSKEHPEIANSDRGDVTSGEAAMIGSTDAK